MIIYKITNEVNGKIYIGKTTKTIEERFQKHLYTTNGGSKTYLHRAIRKYGADNFSLKTLEVVKGDIDEREIHWISNLNPDYNMTTGGEGGGTSLSPNFKSAMKKYHASKKPEDYATYGMLGKKFPESAKFKISKANSYPVVCDGVEYASVKEAQEQLKGVSVRRRLVNPNYPTWYRLRAKRVYNRQSEHHKSP